MFNSFPQPRPDAVGGSPNLLNWSAYQTVYDLTGTAVSVPISSWNTFVDITGKGFLKWCRMDATGIAGTANPTIRLTIDGIPYLFDTANAGANQQGNEINHEIPFKSSLKIEGQNRYASNPANITCDYLYLLQQSTPSKEITLLSQSQRKMNYLTGSSQTLLDVVNVTGSGYLLEVKFLGYGPGSVFGDLTIDGVNKMANRELYDSNTEAKKQPDFVGPIRFNSALRIKTRTSVTGNALTCFAWYSLD